MTHSSVRSQLRVQIEQGERMLALPLSVESGMKARAYAAQLYMRVSAQRRCFAVKAHWSFSWASCREIRAAGESWVEGRMVLSQLHVMSRCWADIHGRKLRPDLPDSEEGYHVIFTETLPTLSYKPIRLTIMITAQTLS